MAQHHQSFVCHYLLHKQLHATCIRQDRAKFAYLVSNHDILTLDNYFAGLLSDLFIIQFFQHTLQALRSQFICLRQPFRNSSQLFLNRYPQVLSTLFILEYLISKKSSLATLDYSNSSIIHIKFVKCPFGNVGFISFEQLTSLHVISSIFQSPQGLSRTLI